jgi:hypothetical protein
MSPNIYDHIYIYLNFVSTVKWRFLKWRLSGCALALDFSRENDFPRPCFWQIFKGFILSNFLELYVVLDRPLFPGKGVLKSMQLLWSFSTTQEQTALRNILLLKEIQGLRRTGTDAISKKFHMKQIQELRIKGDQEMLWTSYLPSIRLNNQ